MIKRPDTNAQRMKRHQRVRAKVSGTPERPRLNVFRSENNIYAQVIDDVAGNTLVAASTLDKEIEGNGGNKAAARAVGKIRKVLPDTADIRMVFETPLHVVADSYSWVAKKISP